MKTESYDPVFLFVFFNFQSQIVHAHLWGSFVAESDRMWARIFPSVVFWKMIIKKKDSDNKDGTILLLLHCIRREYRTAKDYPAKLLISPSESKLLSLTIMIYDRLFCGWNAVNSCLLFRKLFCPLQCFSHHSTVYLSYLIYLMFCSISTGINLEIFKVGQSCHILN